MIDSKELGKLKLECEIVKGYLVGDKIYAFKDINGDIKIKTKSVKSYSLDFNDFIRIKFRIINSKNFSIKSSSKSIIFS